MSGQEFHMKPVGYIRNADGNTRLELDREFSQALDGLSGFSHVLVVFWCHLTDNADCRSITEMDKPYSMGPDHVGVFATRSPVRPNPIGITPVQVTRLDVQNGLVHIPCIDAEDGTPILDIKPYHPSIDRLRTVETPDWCAHWPKWLEDSAEFDWNREFNF
jgi:tRNA-Thr(GGU) m(6)t(6)A37 methyltransferase TsaA